MALSVERAKDSGPVDSDSMSVLGGGLCGEGGDEPQHPALLGTGELANVIVSGVVMFE